MPKQRKALQLIELQNHIFLITDKGQNEWVHLAKTSWDLFNAYPSSPKNPTYCANNKWYGWTLEGDSVMDRLQPIVILCPESFTKQNLYNEDIPDQLDLSPQPVGKVLDQMEPRVLTWYHEMFHVVFDPSPHESFQSFSSADLAQVVALSGLQMHLTGEQEKTATAD